MLQFGSEDHGITCVVALSKNETFDLSIFKTFTTNVGGIKALGTWVRVKL